MVHTEPGRPGNRTFYEKSLKTWDVQGISYNFHPSQGKIRKRDYLVHV